MIDISLYQYELKFIIQDLIKCEYPKAMKTGKGYRFKCPLCNDSDHKARGNFMLDNSKYGYKFKCFNAGCEGENGIDILKFLKSEFNDYYKRFWREILKAHSDTELAERKRKERKRLEKYNVERIVPKKIVNEKIDIANVDEFNKRNLKDLKNAVPMIENQVAVDWCRGRMIPPEVYSKWFYIPNDSGRLSNRIIIPFRNSEGQIYYFQGRTLVNDDQKYKNSYGTKGVYNYFEVDITKPVIIVEGPIDSLFLENSIAIMGVSADEEVMKTIKQKYYLFDCDESGRRAAQKRLENGEWVFMWKSFIKNFSFVGSKVDINVLAIKLNKQKFTFEELKPYFTNNIMFKPFI